MLLRISEWEVPSPQDLETLLELGDTIVQRWEGVAGLHGVVVAADRERLRFVIVSYWDSIEHRDAVDALSITSRRVMDVLGRAQEIRAEWWELALTAGMASSGGTEGGPPDGA